MAKNLFKILVAAAWLDGEIQPEEREYLHQLAETEGIATDPEIRPLLSQLRAIQPKECYEWIKEYLGENPSLADHQNLLEAVSGLVYRDGEVAVEEARLLTELQSLNPATTTPQHRYNAVLKEIRKLYRGWVDSKS